MATDRAEQKRTKPGLAAEVARTTAAATQGEEPALVGVRFAPRVTGGRICLVADWAVLEGSSSSSRSGSGSGSGDYRVVLRAEEEHVLDTHDALARRS